MEKERKGSDLSDDIKSKFQKRLEECIDLTPAKCTIIDFTEGQVPEIGSHIARRSGSVYWHHGIYIGDEDGKRKVIHMTGLDVAHAKIEKTTLKVFLDGRNELVVVEYDNDTPAKRDDTIKMAKLLRKEFRTVDGLYNILECNCEHFACFCRTGQLRYVDDILKNVKNIKSSNTKSDLSFFFPGQNKSHLF